MTSFEMILTIISVFVLFLNIFFLSLVNARNFAVISCIEMLKNKKTVRSIIRQQKEGISKAFVKLFKHAKNQVIDSSKKYVLEEPGRIFLKEVMAILRLTKGRRQADCKSRGCDSRRNQHLRLLGQRLRFVLQMPGL